MTSESNKCKSGSLNLFDISWEDVLFPKLAIHLSLKDSFNLRCCSKTSKKFVDESFRFLKIINFAGNNSTNINLAFAVLAQNCHKLERLYLARCEWLVDELMLSVLSRNKRLKVVNLNECVKLTPLSLQPIIINCKELQVLNLSKCDWLTTGTVDALTLHQNNIEEFDISHCSTIGERCLVIFFRKMNKLTILSLAFSQSVTNNVLIQVANFCKSLEHINLSGCSAITDQGIQ